MAIAFLVGMRKESNRVNEVTEQYIDQIIKNSWIIGCSQATLDFNKCRELGMRMDWNRLIPDIKKASK